MQPQIQPAMGDNSMTNRIVPASAPPKAQATLVLHCLGYPALTLAGQPLPSHCRTKPWLS